MLLTCENISLITISKRGGRYSSELVTHCDLLTNAALCRHRLLLLLLLLLLLVLLLHEHVPGHAGDDVGLRRGGRVYVLGGRWRGRRRQLEAARRRVVEGRGELLLVDEACARVRV